MASWTDGAAYAPIERPDGFATPEVAPLEVAPPEKPITPGPTPKPAGFEPTGPTTPLTHIGAIASPERNPSVPFQISGGLLTAASSMGGASTRDPRTPFQSQTTASNIATLPPPTGAPLPAPDGLSVAPMGAPGHQQLPAPSLSPQQQSTQRTLVFLAVVCTVLGLTIPAAAPWMLFAAGLLTIRTTALTGQAGIWSMIVGLLLLAFGVLLPLDVGALLGRLIALVFGVWFAVAAATNAKKRR